jgi:hypothetical protein
MLLTDHFLTDGSFSMTHRARSADLPLHGGHVPKLLVDRMTRLRAVMSME